VEGPNAAQIELWNGPRGRRWAEQQDHLDRSLAQAHDALLALAAPRPGERSLDIGCGCGTSTIDLARRSGARTVGVDVSAPMLELARARGPGVEFVEADAATYDFEPEFDLVLSRFGVMFFADPVAAFANIRGALAAGGRLVFACFRAMSENAWARVPLDAARDLVQPKPSDPNAPGPFAFAGSGRVRDVLDLAGFREIRVERHDCEMHMGPTVDVATQRALDFGPLARLVDEAEVALRARLRDRVAAALGPYARPSGIDVGMAIWLVSARG
jgi:SAM-dependent methyltransferase